jgi:hypothetical protein
MSKPVKKFHSGPIVASLWADNKVVNNEMVTVYTISIDKAYKAGDTWKYTKTFVPEDLLKVADAAEKAYRHLRPTGDQPEENLSESNQPVSASEEEQA